MNTYANANAYKNMEVTSSNRLKLIVMVYDAAIASLKQSVVSHQRNDISKRNQYISRAQFILHELNNSLDMQKGKEISATLRRLYHFLTRHLGSVMTDNEIQKVDESIKLLASIRESWQAISQEELLEGSSPQQAAVYHSGGTSFTG